MNSSELSECGVGLAEHGRASLAIAELNAILIHLGTGGYSDAIEIVLTAIDRAAGPQLPDQLAKRLAPIVQEQYLGPGCADLLSKVSRPRRPAP
ncbi:hypothetical protein [Mycobacterium sp. GA-2829]|uniref:hypothetical protein n=1 Tax=Mycobacterium sp. GA-2829 TaxID=1772283 RepID=UPI000B278ED3|nr:hypothetical protein [Mycobacterium sp. GA-2829]